MTETTTSSHANSQDALWSEMYTGAHPFVDEADRKFWPADLPPEELRKIGDAIVQAAYINDGVRPEKYGGRVAQVGACIGTAKRVARTAWQKGWHASYVENPDGTHGYVHLPTSADELDTVPKDPLILDPTYAQFMNEYVPDPETGMLPDPWDMNVSKERTNIGIKKGHHTPDSPYFIGRASALKAPDSGVLHIDGRPTPWTDPVVPEQPTGPIRA